MLIENQLCKTSTQHRKNSKQGGIVVIDSCFALFGARQNGATTRESSGEKYTCTLILNPAPELSTTTESHHTTCLVGGGGGKSPSVKLMSRRENKKCWPLVCLWCGRAVGVQSRDYQIFSDGYFTTFSYPWYSAGALCAPELCYYSLTSNGGKRQY